jgi:copper chaperone CopZ
LNLEARKRNEQAQSWGVAMNRRKFLYGVVAGAAGTTAAGIGLAKTSLGKREEEFKASRSVTYGVKGFTCVTCATGLEVMLQREEGIVSASASYPEENVTVVFDESLISEDQIKKFIANCGFSVA